MPGALRLACFFAVPLGITVAISFGVPGDARRRDLRLAPRQLRRRARPAVRARCCCGRSAYAAATAAICLVIGYPVAYTIARYGGRWKNALIAAVLLPFLINYLVRTYAWVALLADEGLVNNVIGTGTSAGSTRRGR